jgi:hypothetical protein
MKTVRFTHVVEQSGRPEVYLLLTAPEKDAHFQQALSAHRLMTIQHAAGKTDFGTVGYDPKARGEILVFPRSLRSFADARIVGINYDLLDQELEPEKPEPKPEPKAKPAPQKAAEINPHLQPAPKPKPESKAKRRAAEKAEAAARQAEFDLKHEPRPPAKVISFSHPDSQEEDDDDTHDNNDQTEELDHLKTGIRRALKALEAGKQVAAFNILKRMVE